MKSTLVCRRPSLLPGRLLSMAFLMAALFLSALIVKPAQAQTSTLTITIDTQNSGVIFGPHTDSFWTVYKVIYKVAGVESATHVDVDDRGCQMHVQFYDMYSNPIGPETTAVWNFSAALHSGTTTFNDRFDQNSTTSGNFGADAIRAWAASSKHGFSNATSAIYYYTMPINAFTQSLTAGAIYTTPKSSRISIP